MRWRRPPRRRAARESARSKSHASIDCSFRSTTRHASYHATLHEHPRRFALYRRSMITPDKTSPPRALSDLRAALLRRRAQLLEIALATDAEAGREAPGIAFGRRNARILDDLLTSLYQGLRTGEIVTAARSAVPPHAWDEVELAGVGSYGRGAVALKSDLD